MKFIFLKSCESDKEMRINVDHIVYYEASRFRSNIPATFIELSNGSCIKVFGTPEEIDKELS